MTPVIKSEIRNEQGVRNDGRCGSRADCIVEQVQTYKQFAKVVMSCEVGETCCSKDKEVDISDFVLVRGAKDEVTSGMVHFDWEKVSNVEPIA